MSNLYRRARRALQHITLPRDTYEVLLVARDDAVQDALRTVAAELLPADRQVALGSRYTADDLALALGEHFTGVAADNGRAGYRRGYAANLVNTARDTDDGAPIRVTGGGATLLDLQFTGRPADVDTEAAGKARHRTAIEVAQSMARQLYGDAGRHVRDPADLIALVRAKTEFEVRAATGEQFTEGTAVHTPLRDERIRRDALRAVLSWVSQNWNLTLDGPDPATPEVLGARLSAAMDQRVTQARRAGLKAAASDIRHQLLGPTARPPDADAETYTDMVRDIIERARRGRDDAESEVCGGILRYLGIAYDEPTDKPLIREDAAFLIRKHISAEASRRARAVDIRQDTIQEISDGLATAGFWRDENDHRLTQTPVMPPAITPREFVNRIHNQRTRTLVRRANAQRGALLRALGQGHRVQDARSVPAVAEVVSGMLDEQTALTAYRIIRESLGAKAAKPLLDEQAAFGDVTREAIIQRARDIVAQAVAAGTGQLGEVVR